MKNHEVESLIRGSHDGLSERIGRIERGESNTKEKFCPNCEHITLMKVIPSRSICDMLWDGKGNWTYRNCSFYCYTCGKTFREQKSLVEVEVSG